MQKTKNIAPKILEAYTIGNRGESFLEFIMSKNALFHKISGYKDIGLDYLCEWITKGSPTRALFGIQVKTSDIDDVNLEHKGRNAGLNGLEIYRFNKTIPSWNITEKTINYWFGFDIPLYLFFVLKNKQVFDCYYQRLTPILHKKDRSMATKEIQGFKNNDLYKANMDNNFMAVVDRGRQDGGFARDLFFDSVRCSYFSGSIKHREAKEFGLKGWDGEGVYVDILGEEDRPYMDILDKSLPVMHNLGIINVNPNWKQKITSLKENLKKR